MFTWLTSICSMPYYLRIATMMPIPISPTPEQQTLCEISNEVAKCYSFCLMGNTLSSPPFPETGVPWFPVITRMRPGLQQAYLSASPKAILCKNFLSPVSEATVAEEPAMLVKWKDQADPSACGAPVAWCSGMFCHTRSRIRFCWANKASEGEMIQPLILWQKPSLQEDSFKG